MRNEHEKIYIYGKHALAEALLHSPRAVKKVFISSEANDPELRDLLKRRGIVPAAIKNREASHMVGEDTAHQGVIAVVDPSEIMVDFEDFKATLASTENTALVLLDELTDPHNVGAIIRSAVAFGAAGILMPVYRQAPVTGAVIKASAGMAFRIPIVQIGNVNFTVGVLQKMGFLTYGLAMKGAKKLGDEPFGSPALFVVGNEGKGIRQKTLEHCDVTLRIPMDPRCESLNASVSAAVVLYAWSVKHPGALTAPGAGLHAT